MYKCMCQWSAVSRVGFGAECTHSCSGGSGYSRASQWKSYWFFFQRLMTGWNKSKQKRLFSSLWRWWWCVVVCHACMSFFSSGNSSKLNWRQDTRLEIKRHIFYRWWREEDVASVLCWLDFLLLLLWFFWSAGVKEERSFFWRWLLAETWLCVHGGGGGVVMSFVLCGFLSLSPFLLMIMMTCSCFLCFLFCLKSPKSKERITNAIKKDVKGIFFVGFIINFNF